MAAMMNVMFAALCLVQLASAMYINPSFRMLDYDKPDRKIFRKGPGGMIHAYDVSSEISYMPNGQGGLSAYNVIDVSDPDLHGFGGAGMGMPNMAGARMASPTGFNQLMPGITASSFSAMQPSFQMPVTNYIQGYHPYQVLG